MNRAGEKNLESAAKEARGNWRKFQCFVWHGKPDDCGEFTIVYTHNRDSGLLDLSNAHVIEEALAKFTEGDDPDVRSEHHNHWACGWVCGHAIRVYRDGRITDVFKTYYELCAALSDYPILDEKDYSQREYDATIKNIRNTGYDGGIYAPPDGWEERVYSWLWDNDQGAVENSDDQGGCPSKEEVANALDGLEYRILWDVSYMDVGPVCEEFDEEASAARRCEELRSRGIYATYDSHLPDARPAETVANFNLEGGIFHE
jgi:hypothetical protein